MGVALGMGFALAPTARAGEITVAAPTGSAIQAALDAAARDGSIDTVTLTAGAYTLDRALRVPTGLTLRGRTDNPADTVLRYAGNDTAIIDLTDRSGVTVTGLTLDGSAGSAGIGVLAWGANQQSQNLALTNLDIRHIGNTAPAADPQQFGVFLAGNVSGSRITGNTITDINPASQWSAGIRIAHGSSGNTVEHNTIATTGRGGILANDHATDLVIRHNAIADTGRAGDGNDFGLGIELWNGSHRSVVEHNTMDRWLSIDASDFVAVRHNTVRGHGGPDAFAGLEFVSSRYLVAADNSVDDGSHLGISISGDEATRHGLFLRNTVKNADTWGVQVFGQREGVDQLYFRDNAFTGAAPDGNTLYGAAGDGIRLLGNVDDLVFDGNTIADNAGRAIDILADGNPDVVFINNRVDDNGNNHTPTDAAGNARGDATSSPTLAEPGAAEPTAAQPPAGGGEPPLSLEFAGIEAPVLVLWDAGEGTPRATGSAVLPFSDLHPGQTVSAVAWDAQGRAAFAEFTMGNVPEPAIAAGLLLIFTGLQRRRSARCN